MPYPTLPQDSPTAQKRPFDHASDSVVSGDTYPVCKTAPLPSAAYNFPDADLVPTSLVSADIALRRALTASLSIIHLTDIVLRSSPSGLDHNLPDESHISLKVLLDNNKAKVIGPLIKGPESSWKSVENLQLPTGVLSFKITPRRLENYEFTPLGSAEFFCDNLIAMSLAQINEVVQPLVAATCDGPAFELCFSCVVIPSDEPPTIVALNEEQIHQVRAVRQSDQHPVVPYEELAHREALATMLHYQVPESRRKEFLQAFPDLLYQQALTLRDDDPQKRDMLPTVFNLFHSRYAQDKNPLDLDKAIAAVDDVVKITPDGHPRKADMLAQRGAFLLLRIEHQLGNEHIPTTADFEGAISDLERSLTVTPDDGMPKPNRLRNLGIVFRHRCDLTGDINDLDKPPLQAHLPVPAWALIHLPL
ncbi:hypothetical protein PILCRDRAFT_16298 [Piloderma croceum F 1598]|uniref:Uncharacterized protein n=1 Tax=Piloderma croceum (strain F 1598) TaxID=765440 RepID=A0A0C3EHZ6_PILCF|nr:hypothetical protein PILCRDRAFT_16298 [Piloderma croceum F 1598]